MKTVQDILTENRESVISSIKYIFRVYRPEDIQTKMVEFMNFCEKRLNVEAISKSKKVKTDLKNLLCRMNMEASAKSEKEHNMRIYGKEKVSVAERMAYHHEGETFDHLKKEWVSL